MSIYDVAIQQWIIGALNDSAYDDQTVFRSQQEGVRPDSVHVTYLDILGQDTDYSVVKKEETDPVSDNYKVTYTAPKNLIYSVNIYAPNGADLLSTLWKSRNLLIPRLALRSVGLVLRGKGDINEVPTSGDTSWRRQYHRDFTFGLFTSDAEEVEKLYTYRLVGAWKRTETTGDKLDVVLTD